jgi:hypothetical protein
LSRCCPENLVSNEFLLQIYDTCVDITITHEDVTGQLVLIKDPCDTVKENLTGMIAVVNGKEVSQKIVVDLCQRSFLVVGVVLRSNGNSIMI